MFKVVADQNQVSLDHHVTLDRLLGFFPTFLTDQLFICSQSQGSVPLSRLLRPFLIIIILRGTITYILLFLLAAAFARFFLVILLVFIIIVIGRLVTTILRSAIFCWLVCWVLLLDLDEKAPSAITDATYSDGGEKDADDYRDWDNVLHC